MILRSHGRLGWVGYGCNLQDPTNAGVFVVGIYPARARATVLRRKPRTNCRMSPGFSALVSSSSTALRTSALHASTGSGSGSGSGGRRRPPSRWCVARENHPREEEHLLPRRNQQRRVSSQRVLSSGPARNHHLLLLHHHRQSTQGGHRVVMVSAAGEGGAENGGGGPRMFVVRHEKRPVDDPRFHVSLTEAGLSDAAEVVEPILKSHGITKVYASPFKRVLQTVQPFLSNAGLKAHVDWALYEHPEPNPEPVTAIPGGFHADFAIEANYEPYVRGDDIAEVNDSFDAVHARIRGLVRHLAQTHGEGDVLLLATHQTSVHSLIHQGTGVPMESLNVPMGAVVELQWRSIIQFGE